MQIHKACTSCQLSIFCSGLDLLDQGSEDDKKKKKETGEIFVDRGPPALPPSSGPCECLPGKRENRENLLRERRRGGGDATDGERGGVTAEREKGEEGAKRERER